MFFRHYTSTAELYTAILSTPGLARRHSLYRSRIFRFSPYSSWSPRRCDRILTSGSTTTLLNSIAAASPPSATKFRWCSPSKSAAVSSNVRPVRQILWGGEAADNGEGSTFCFHNKNCNEGKLDYKPGTIHNVVLPADGSKCPRIHELVECYSQHQRYILIEGERNIISIQHIKKRTITAKPFALTLYGKISRVYATTKGV